MRRLALILLLLTCVSVQGQIRIYSTYAENYAATQLQEFLEKGGCQTTFGGKSTGRTVYVGLPSFMKERYKPLLDSLRDDGFFIVGDGKEVVLHGAGEKGTLYAVYAFLEMMGYRLYTPDAMVVPDVSKMQLPKCHIVSNPAFEWREVSYYYPNHSQLYADWHHIHTQADREHMFGMFVHTFQRLLPPSRYFDEHPQWFSLNNGRRSRDGQLCLSNPEVLEVLCQRLADTMQALPTRRIWSVSPNDNYNVCRCSHCLRLDSLCGGPSGTLLWFVNQVARRFPDKTIATLAYQYTRTAPTSTIRPDSNVLIMLCPIEVGRELPIATAPKEAAFREDMADWSRIADNLFVWDYVVQFRNFWDPFPNLHVLQSNLQFFRRHNTHLMFEQASGSNNVTSWMDIRCYMIAKLLWDTDADMDSIMDDFYKGYYGAAGGYVKAIIDTMTAALVNSGQRLDIYGYAVDGCFADGDSVGYLWPSRMERYYDLMRQAYATNSDTAVRERLRFFEMALDFATVELKAHDMYGDFAENDMTDMVDSLIATLKHFGVGILMEMGVTPDEYGALMRRWCEKSFSRAFCWHQPVTLRHPATSPYNTASLTDGEGGIMDYRHRWLGFWGDTLDAVVDLGATCEIRSVSIDFYFYPLSWIFLPQWVRFQTSDDGTHWQPFGASMQGENPEVLATPSIHTFAQTMPQKQRARYVRVTAAPIAEIPAWHRAAGQKAWIFTDEIIVK